MDKLGRLIDKLYEEAAVAERSALDRTAKGYPADDLVVTHDMARASGLRYAAILAEEAQREALV